MLSEKKFIVSGGAGFLGRYVVDALVRKGVESGKVFVPRSVDFDLRKWADVSRMFKEFHADIIIHLATVSGGICYYKDHPGKVFYDNLMMGTQVMEIARQNNAEKVVLAGSTLAYPKDAPIPYKEEDLWKGLPQETEAAYGISNRILHAHAKSYREEYGFNAIYLIFANLYGPRDHFDESVHVIPSLIKIFHEAKAKNIEELSLCGSGNATREFIYVKDAADALVTAIERYNSIEPLNIGSGMEISIKSLAEKISKMVGFKGRIVWDSIKPEGRMRRAIDSNRAKELLGLEKFVDFEEGLKRTIEWYIENINERQKLTC